MYNKVENKKKGIRDISRERKEEINRWELNSKYHKSGKNEK
jgi:hypothetical protein